MAGRIHIGLSDSQLTALGQARDVAKLSRADLAACLVRGGVGATTVAATMICARLAGIGVFATGGIGGVHRGAETSFDISATCWNWRRRRHRGCRRRKGHPGPAENAGSAGNPRGSGHFLRSGRFPRLLVALVRAEGAAAHGQRGPDCRGAPHARPAGPARRPAGRQPDPAEDEIAAEVIGPHIRTALAEAEAKGISAKAVTPFLLQRIFELTEGRSLQSNIALVLSNARLAAAIAVELARPG